MACFPSMKKSAKHEEEADDEFFDFSYYKIERSKTAACDNEYVSASATAKLPKGGKGNGNKIGGGNHEDDVLHQKKFASIFAWLEGQENAIAEAGEASSIAGGFGNEVECPCCHNLDDCHYACTDVTLGSKLITFSPHRRNFDSDVKYSRTASFSHNVPTSVTSHNVTRRHQSSSGSAEFLAGQGSVEFAKQRTMSLSTQYRYQSMNQPQQPHSRSQPLHQQPSRGYQIQPRGQQKLPQQDQELSFHYSTPNSQYDYVSNEHQFVSSSSRRSTINSRTGLIEKQPVHKSSSTAVKTAVLRRNSQGVASSHDSLNSPPHSRTGSLDNSSNNTEYIYLDFQNSISEAASPSQSSDLIGYNSSWQVTRKQPSVESPIRKIYY
eukprot:TRINITY_DN11763_c0_g1_i3.p1 TRINITY_DN11763_c0_g1~~TRINITY_DN11763_c0_g1_i3.p1  ORF type:complete len:379 (+),score=70.11 TRINITY_DN11763_c0_g1_i3:65-1201(+)